MLFWTVFQIVSTAESHSYTSYLSDDSDITHNVLREMFQNSVDKIANKKTSQIQTKCDMPRHTDLVIYWFWPRWVDFRPYRCKYGNYGADLLKKPNIPVMLQQDRLIFVCSHLYATMQIRCEFKCVITEHHGSCLLFTYELISWQKLGYGNIWLFSYVYSYDKISPKIRVHIFTQLTYAHVYYLRRN